jgi:hypothetical protein
MTMAARLLTTVTPKPPSKPMAPCSNAMVTLDVVIGADGKISTVKRAGGFEEFLESAIAAVKQWTYKPYLVDGVPTSVETSILVFYPSSGPAGSLFVPDGKGGVKGGKFEPMPPSCGPEVNSKPSTPE